VKLNAILSSALGTTEHHAPLPRKALSGPQGRPADVSPRLLDYYRDPSPSCLQKRTSAIPKGLSRRGTSVND
jgi:hypothetical protein